MYCFFQVFSSIELEPKYVLLIVGAIYQVRQLLLEYHQTWVISSLMV